MIKSKVKLKITDIIIIEKVKKLSFTFDYHMLHTHAYNLILTYRHKY